MFSVKNFFISNVKMSHDKHRTDSTRFTIIIAKGAKRYSKYEFVFSDNKQTHTIQNNVRRILMFILLYL